MSFSLVIIKLEELCYSIEIKVKNFIFLPFVEESICTWTDRTIKQYPVHAVPIPIDKSNSSLFICRKGRE